MPRGAPYGWDFSTEHFRIAIPGGTAQANSVLSLPRGFAHVITAVKTIVAIAAAGAGATRTFNVRKGSATGTVVATATWVLADGATVGVVKDIPVTAANAEFVDADNLTIEWATAGAVAFTAGEIIVSITTRRRSQRSA